jgi:hypothetical protein
MTTTFAIISTNDITSLATDKASGCVWAVYSTLLQFSRNKASCFPSVPTINKVLGESYTIRAIQKSLLWLEERKYIKRNDHKSKERFVMLKKVVSATIKTLTNKSSHKQGTKVPYKKRKENYSFFKRKKQNTSSYSPQKTKSTTISQQDQNYADSSTVERAFMRFLIAGNGESLSVLSDSERSALSRGLKTNEEAEWKMWVWEYHPKLARHLLSVL